MNRTRTRWNAIGMLVLIAPALLTAGCETAGQSALLGGVLGAGTGAVAGHQSGHAGEGALIGAAAGALTGYVVHEAYASKQRSAQQTAQDYNYNPQAGPGLMLTPEDAWIIPSPVKKGALMEAKIRYVLLGSGAGVQVTETRTLFQGGQKLGDLSTTSVTRTDGTWESTLPIKANFSPGLYTMVQTVSTGGNRVEKRTDFEVTQ